MSSSGALLVPPDAELQPVDWQTIDDACFDWLNDLLALDNRVIWSDQKVTQQDYPYISLKRGPETDEGGNDEIRNQTLDANGDVIPPGGVATPATNREVVYQPVQFTLNIQAYANPEAGGNDPGCNPMKLLSKAKRSLGLTSIANQLFTAGISIVEPLAVNDISIVVNAEWINRASMDVILRTASVMSEEVGFIEKTQLVSTQLGVDVIVDAS